MGEVPAARPGCPGRLSHTDRWAPQRPVLTASPLLSLPLAAARHASPAAAGGAVTARTELGPPGGRGNECRAAGHRHTATAYRDLPVYNYLCSLGVKDRVKTQGCLPAPWVCLSSSPFLTCNTGS